MKSRILHVIDHLGYGGAPTVVKNIVEQMACEHIEIFVCALRTNPRAMPIKTRLINFTYHKYNPYTILAIAKLCKKHDIDIIHAHLQKSVISSLLASYFCDSKVIIHEHGPIFRGGTGFIYRLLLRALRSRNAVAIANSQATKEALVKTAGLAENSIHVVANFINLSKFDPSLYNKQKIKKKLNIAQNEIVVGFVGRLDPCKGADLLLDAADILRSKNRKYRFVIVGDGSQRPQLEKQVTRLGLEGHVIFTGLSQNPAEISAVFDIAVMPSRREAFGIAAIEFMKMKIPVIASPVGGLPGLVKHEKTGILLDNLSPENITTSIDKLADDNLLREKLIKNAEEFSVQFAGTVQLKQLENIYSSLAEKENNNKLVDRTADTINSKSSENQIQFNIKVHNEINKKYEQLHREIFNPIEQERLHEDLSLAIEAVKTNSKPLAALDFGCGSGNLTRHLIDMDVKTISADVSQVFLSLIEQEFSNNCLSEVLKLNGKDLSNIQTGQLDLVATYSVLHHVPDYLHIVGEMCRVLKNGGVIYIDHEVIKTYYDRPKEYVEFLRKAKPKLNLRRYLRLFLDVKGYRHIFRRILNPRYKREGDIHVWPDDHIEWDKIKQILASEGFEIILERDYLLYKRSYKLDVYNQYKDKCADQRVLAARKMADKEKYL